MFYEGLYLYQKTGVNTARTLYMRRPLVIYDFATEFPYIREKFDLLFYNCLYRAGPRPHIPFPPDLILYVNLVAKGALKFFRTLAPRLTVLDIPYFADAYNRTVRPIDLRNF